MGTSAGRTAGTTIGSRTAPSPPQLPGAFPRALARVGVAVALIGLLLTLSCAAERPRLVLLIVVDTLRADHLGCYGYDAVQTPNIDRLAAEGMLFEDAVTAVPVTLPSMATILTGAYPAQHGIRDNGPYQLDERWTTLAEHLHEAGYATGAFVSAAVLSKDHGLDQGFEVYDDDVSMPYETSHPLMVPMLESLQGIERRAATTVDRALAWLDDTEGRNALLLVHLFDPHVPQDPPEPFATEYAGRLYDGEIAYTDAEIGRLLDGARRHGHEVVTIFVADHGEGLGDHGEAFHGDLLFQATMRVPLILHGPGIARGVRSTEFVRTIDIVPTVCALEGIAAPPWAVGAPLPGIGRGDGTGTEARRSDGTIPSGAVAVSHEMDPLLRAGRRGRTAYLETLRPRLGSGWCELRGLRTHDWKLVEGPGRELYDMYADPGEARDVADQHPAVRDSLAALMDATALAAVRHGSHHAASLKISAEDREKLRSLGYVTAAASRPATSDSMAVFYFPPEERGRALGLSHPRERVGENYKRIVADSYYSAGRGSLERGDHEAAARAFKEAIRLQPQFVDAYLGFAEAATATGRHTLAVEILEGARKEAPDDARVLRALADALVRSGQTDDAVRLLEDVVHKSSDDPSLREKLRVLRSTLRP